MKPDLGFERFYEREAQIVFGAVFLLRQNAGRGRNTRRIRSGSLAVGPARA